MSADDDSQKASANNGHATAGTQLSGIYELDQRIAFGGMGEVWRGHNIHTGDDVAIKIVLPELARDQAILSLFRKEASILNHLSHDAVVRYHVFTVAPNIGRPYLAMEFVGGESLLDVMRRGPMPVDDVRRLCRRLALGLHAVHEAGAVHRDLSPDNIILPQASVEKAKIIDFGIARSSQMGETLIGDKFAGKYNYVSPEQVGLYGGEVARQSDVYSLGLVLAGALRGRPLEMGGSHLEIVEKRRAVPDISDLDENFRPILTAMLQPQPRDRPASMAVVATLAGGEAREGADTAPPRYHQPAAIAPWDGPATSRPASTAPSARVPEPAFVPHEPPAHLVRFGAASAAPGVLIAPRRRLSTSAVAIASVAALSVVTAGGLYLTGWLSLKAAEAPEPVALTASNDVRAVAATPPSSDAQPTQAPQQPSSTASATQDASQPAPASSPAPAPAVPVASHAPPQPQPPAIALPPQPASEPIDQTPVDTKKAMSPLPASTKVEQMQPVVDATSTAASTAAPEADLLGKLAAVGIDYSVAEADIEDWIVNIYTPYPAFAGALLNLLKDRVLRKPVYIDVIAGNYEGAPGGSAPGSVEEVDTDRLKAAVLAAYNVRHGEKVRSFDEILQ